MRIYFGPGFSMTCAGQEIATDKDGFAEVVTPTPEIMAWAKPEPKKATTTEGAEK
jgi:hypothetical protein